LWRPSFEPNDEAALSTALAPLDVRDPAATVVLIGSSARHRMTWRSDIDVFVITSKPIQRLRGSPRIHIHHETRESFLARLNEGEEFASWAVRYGRLLCDPSGWWRIARRENLPWPDWRQKLAHVRKRMRIAKAALIDADREAAEEELMMAVSHCARALLLQNRAFPLSRPELPSQLASIDQKELGDLLSQLIAGSVPLPDLKRAFVQVQRLYGRLRVEAHRDEGDPTRRVVQAGR
jgi:predicted nucleotidyltransferase